MQKPNYAYQGIFVSPTDIQHIIDVILNDNPAIASEVQSWRFIANPHVTTSFTKGAPYILYQDVGTPAGVEIDGYGYDAEKGLFALHVSSAHSPIDSIQTAIDMTAQTKPLHITLAVGHGAKPKQSPKLFLDGKEYTPFPIPIELSGTYGGFTYESTVDILNDTERDFYDYVSNILRTRQDEFAKALRSINTKEIGDIQLKLLQLLEQAKQHGGHFGDISAKEVFDKIASVTEICWLQQQVKQANKACFEGLLNFAKKDAVLTNPKDVLLQFQTTDEYKQLKQQLQESKALLLEAQQKLSQKYPEMNQELIRETTKKDMQSSEGKATTRTFEIPLSGTSDIIDVKQLPDDAIIYLAYSEHGESLSVMAFGAERKQSDISTLEFQTNELGECIALIASFFGRTKQAFEFDASDDPSFTVTEFSILTKQDLQEYGIEFVRYSSELPEPVKEKVVKILEEQKKELEAEMDYFDSMRGSEYWRAARAVCQINAKLDELKNAPISISKEQEEVRD